MRENGVRGGRRRMEGEGTDKIKNEVDQEEKRKRKEGRKKW